MIDKEYLKKLGELLMFQMEDSEYDTLLKEFDTTLKQMELIENIPNIKDVSPMTFPFLLDEINLRSDNNARAIKTEDVLKNAKDTYNDQVKVPKVVE